MLFKRIMISVCALLMSAAGYAQVSVIINPANPNALNTKDVQRIFLGKDKKYPDGSEIIAINLDPSTQTRNDFDTEVLGRSSSQVAAFWSKLVFTGKGIPPKEVMTDAEMLQLVASNPSVIGYISSSTAASGVKVVPLTE